MSVLIAIGSNLGAKGLTPQDIVRESIAACGVFATVLRRSYLYLSPSWPDPSHPDYVNAVIAVETDAPPDQLLDKLHEVEARFGRERSERWAPRTLDLDLLDYNGLLRTADAPGALTLPHPCMGDRLFVLQPLKDVAPAWRHPETGEGVDDLIARAENAGQRVERLDDAAPSA